jgi:orotidine-5'-phosphate decarboxylase
MQAGSSYLVIGRPIIQAADPLQALQDINSEIEGAVMVKKSGGHA